MKHFCVYANLPSSRPRSILWPGVAVLAVVGGWCPEGNAPNHPPTHLLGASWPRRDDHPPTGFRSKSALRPLNPPQKSKNTTHPPTGTAALRKQARPPTHRLQAETNKRHPCFLPFPIRADLDDFDGPETQHGVFFPPPQDIFWGGAEKISEFTKRIFGCEFGNFFMPNKKVIR